MVEFKDSDKLPVLKPTAQFSLNYNDMIYNSPEGKDINSSAMTMFATVGDNVSIKDLSHSNRGKSLKAWDFQYTRPDEENQFFTNKGFEKTYTLDIAGTYTFSLCVRDTVENEAWTNYWGNWSDNGNHRVIGNNPGRNPSDPSDDFDGYWYFTRIVVIARDKSYSLEEKHIDSETGKVLNQEAHKDITDAQYTTYERSDDFSGYGFIGSRAGYTWEDIANGITQPISSRTAMYDSNHISAFHYYYYKKITPPVPPPAGTANITVYYRNKNTGEAAAPTLEKEGLEYGAYTFEAPVLEGYTFDAAATPSPQTVTVSAANNNFTIIFYYIPQDGGGGDPENKPPIAIAKGPRQELAGANVKFDGRSSYDPDGTIEQYIWQYPGANLAQEGKGYINVWYPYTGNYTRTETVKLTVIDDKGASDSTEVDVDILPPVPTAALNISGIYKENRKVTLDASGSISPSRYPINSYIWTISNPANVKSVAALNGNSKNDVIYKVAGTYSNKIEVKNTVGLVDYETKSVAIVPDQNPKANFSAVVKLLRNPSDSLKNATITATNLSSSSDNDPIKSTVMFYAYDSDNDSSFDDETWYYSLNGTTWLAAGLTYAQLKAGNFDIYTKGTSNPATFTVKTNQVGKYKFEAMTIENIPAADTIPSLITAADYRRNNTFTSKPDSEKIVEVMNTAPTITFEVKKKKEVDILIATDYTGQNLANIQAALNVQKATLLAKNIDVKYTIVNTTSPVAHVNDAKFWYRRYARYNYHADRESWSSGGGGNDHYDEAYQETLLWEEQQALESEVGYLPPRIPRNVSWTKSGIIFEEDENGEKNWEREYYNVTVRAQNDIKTSGVIKKTVYSRSGMASDTSYGYQYSNIHSESVSLDSSFVKEEKISDVVLNVNSIDFAPITSTALRVNSDRYLLFIGDSSSKVYSGEWGTHFPFGGITKSEQDYIKANNIKPYIVTPQAALDTVVGLEKAKASYPGKQLLFKAWDDSYMAILDDYPANVGLEGEIQEVYGDYVLLTNGTLKYRSGGASYGTLVSNVTKCLPVKTGLGQIQYDGNLWVVTSDGKLRQYKSGIPGYVFDYPDATDVFDAYLSNESSGTYIISRTSGTYFMYANGTTKLLSNSASMGFLKGQVDDEYGDSWGYGLILVHTDGKTTAARYAEKSRWNSETRQYEDYLSEVKTSILYKGIYNESTETYSLSGYPVIKPVSVNDWIISNSLHKMDMAYLQINFYGNGLERYFIDSPSYNQNAFPNVADVKDDVIKHTDGRITVPFNWKMARKRSGGVVYYTQELAYLEVPTLKNKTIKKADIGQNFAVILTTDNELYRWIGGAYTTTPSASELVFVVDNVEDIYRNTFNANVNWNTVEQNYFYYQDRTTGQLKNSLDNAVAYDDVVNVKVSDINQNIYVVTGNGKLYGQGYFGEKYGSQQTPIGTLFHELIKTRLVIDDPTKQYITLRSILDNISDTKYFTAGQYAAAVQDITNIYLNDTSYTTNYILVNDEMSFTTAYSDYENDLKFAEEWKFLHEPYYFDNTMGLAPFHGQTLTSPVTKYAKKGRYTINLRARDNPKNDIRFKNDTSEVYNYYKWSTGNQNVLLYVHEKPIALARVTITNNGNDTYTVKALDAGSYDPDHNNSRSDKGIAAREWRWKEATSITWTSGQMNKADCTADKSYIIQLRVKDIEGVWSDYYNITIDKNNPPVALFSLDKTLIKNTEPLKVKDQSYPQSFSTITNWHWIVRKVNADGSASSTDLYKKQATNSNNGTGAMAGYDVNVMTNYSSSGVGTFRVYLRVKDSNGLWSDGGTDSTPGDLSKFYSMDFDVDKAPTPSFIVSKSVIKLSEILKVRDTTTTTGISGIAKWHWIVKKLNADGSAPGTSVKNEIFTNSNTGTEALAGYDSNVTTDYQSYGTGTYRIYLRACNGNGMWSDGGTDTTFTLGSFFYRDIVVDAPPIPGFTIAQNPIEPADILKLRDTSTAAGVSNMDRWHWIVKKLDPDGSVIDEPLQDEQYSTHNTGTGVLAGYDSNVKTDYEDSGPGTYRIYLRVRNANGMWSDEGTDTSKNLEKFFYRDLLVQESFKVSNFRVVKVRDVQLESYYYNPSTGQYDDRPMGVSSMAIDQDNFGGMVDGLTKGYLFEFEIDTVNFNGNNDSIIITPRFFTCQGSSRDSEERDLYWENSYHEILKAGEGAHQAWVSIRLGKENRKITGENKATWRGSYLIPGTSWAVPRGTAASNAVLKKLERDIIVNFGIKAYKAGVMKYDYNQSQWHAERTEAKQPYIVGDVIRYSYEKCNLDDNNVILNRP